VTKFSNLGLMLQVFTHVLTFITLAMLLESVGLFTVVVKCLQKSLGLNTSL